MNEHLLLVEDEDAIADVMQLHLTEAGYSVQRESDGARAMRVIDAQQFDLVLLDLMLPAPTVGTFAAIYALGATTYH